MRKILYLVITGSLLLFLLGTAHAKDPIPPQKTPELLNQGKKLYEQNCAPCHGAKGDGKGPAGLALKPPPGTFNLPLSQWTYSKGDLKKVFEVITKGIPNTSMVKWDQISEQERWALVYYVAEFAAPKIPPKKK
jgi:high-affinity iron transporter